MKFRHALLASLLAAPLLPVAATENVQAAADCAAAATLFRIDGLDVTVSEAVAKEAAIGRSDVSPVAHCVVQGKLDQRTGADGQPYAISFELRLPENWNGGFVHQFNGGNDGRVVPALGQVLGGDRSQTALGRGYAVVSSDAGHDGGAVKDAGLAGGARFGFDPQARRDYGYGAVARLNPVAVQMVEAFYGQPVQRSYGLGSSNGGRHAMVAAVRMPDAFDGLLIAYPGFNLPKAAVQHAHDLKALAAISGDIRTSLSKDDTDVLAKGILAACDGLDGLTDGLAQDIDACQTAFDVSALACKAGQETGCLSQPKIEALQTMLKGPHNSKGEQLYAPWVWDAGMASSNWRMWRVNSEAEAFANLPRIVALGAPSLAQIFTTPPTRVDGSPEALMAYLAAFDFDTDAPKIFAKTDAFPESAMEFMTPPGADNPDLAAFRAAGGKIVLFHGAGDPVFSIRDTDAWFERLPANAGADLDGFIRYYRIAGMPHGASGPTADGFDFFASLTDWVEQGKAPGAVIASVTDGNKEGIAALGKVTRKLCPHPQIARYTGSDPASAESFTCQ